MILNLVSTYLFKIESKFELLIKYLHCFRLQGQNCHEIFSFVLALPKKDALF